MKLVEEKIEICKFENNSNEVKKLEKTLQKYIEHSTTEDYDYVLDKLVDKLQKCIKVEARNISVEKPETIEEIEQKYSQEFLDEIVKLFDSNVYFVHGTQNFNVQSIQKQGLYINNYTLLHTANAVGGADRARLLMTIFNWGHCNSNAYVVLDGDDKHCKYNQKLGVYVLPKKYIKGYIDVENQQVVYNKAHKQEILCQKDIGLEWQQTENQQQAVELQTKQDAEEYIQDFTQQEFVESEFTNLLQIFNYIRNETHTKKDIETMLANIILRKQVYDDMYVKGQEV